jgi:hypothetical protein
LAERDCHAEVGGSGNGGDRKATPTAELARVSMAIMAATPAANATPIVPTPMVTSPARPGDEAEKWRRRWVASTRPPMSPAAIAVTAMPRVRVPTARITRSHCRPTSPTQAATIGSCRG